MYIANYNVNTGKTFFRKGDEVVGLSNESLERLLKIGAVTLIGSAESFDVSALPRKKNIQGTEGDTAHEKFVKMLGEQKKKDLINYAAELNLEVNERMNVKEITDIILKDCGTSGYDFDSLSEEQLSRLVELLEIDVKELDAEARVDAIIAVYEKENE